MRRNVVAIAFVAIICGSVHAQDVGPITHEGVVEAPVEQVWAAFTTYFRHYDHSKPRFSVRHEPGGDVVDDSYLTVVQNTNPYTYLGSRPLWTAPDAGLDMPLTALSWRALNASTLLRAASTALRTRTGPGDRMRKLSYRHHLSKIVVTGYGPFPYQVDGDYLGEAEALEFTWEPEVLRLVRP